MTKNLILLIVLTITVALALEIRAQVQTDVPLAVPNAKPVTVERIKIHGAALEGNLEKNAVDRDVFVFLPPSYPKDKRRLYPVVSTRVLPRARLRTVFRITC